MVVKVLSVKYKDLLLRKQAKIGEEEKRLREPGDITTIKQTQPRGPRRPRVDRSLYVALGGSCC